MIQIKKTNFKPLYDLACFGWKTKFDEFLKKYIFSDIVEFEESFIEEIRSACDPKQLKVFNSIFKDYIGEDLFEVTTYKEVCKRLKEKELTIKDFSHLPEYMRIKALAQAQIQQLAKLFNGNWAIDWSNRNQYKYYPYFEYKVSGGWVCDDCSFRYCHSFGEVAFYKDSKTAEFVGKTFIEIYKRAL